MKWFPHTLLVVYIFKSLLITVRVQQSLGLVEEGLEELALLLGRLLESLVNLLERVQTLGLHGTPNTGNALGKHWALLSLGWLRGGAGTNRQHLLLRKVYFLFKNNSLESCMSEQEPELVFCSTCKCNKTSDNFIKDDTTFKTCNKCRDRRKSIIGTESENGDADDEFTGRNYNYKTRYNRYKADDPNFDIPLDDFVSMIIDFCYYCGKRNLNKGFNGIDRVDSTQPHVLGNCVPCCWECNRMKGAMDVNDFIRQVKWIYQHLNLQNYTDIV
jgi:hypothetical protein